MTNTPIYMQKAQHYYQSERSEMLELVPTSVRKVLELGCGSGEFGKRLKDRGAEEVVGIELQPEPAARAAKLLDKVIVANVDIEIPALPEQYFDCLICNDVLEHLIDPWMVLSRLGSTLVPGGYVVISIPNVRHQKLVRKLFWAGEWNYASEGILDKTHLRFFTKRTAIQLLESGGFKLESVTGLHGGSLPGWMRLWNVICRGRFDDMKYIQFGLVGRKPE